MLGAVGAAAFWVVGESIDSQLLQALGYFGFLLNLFNLIPIGFLDGGQICGAFEYLRRGGATAAGGHGRLRLCGPRRAPRRSA